MPRIKGDNEMNKTPEIAVNRPHLSVRYTRSQLEGTGALDKSTIRRQLLIHFGFSPEKPITVRHEFDARYYEQDIDEPIDTPMFG
jgi:hypothetical protein